MEKPIEVFLVAAGKKDELAGEGALLLHQARRRAIKVGRALGQFDRAFVSEDAHAVDTHIHLLLGTGKSLPVVSNSGLSEVQTGVQAIKYAMIGAAGKRILVVAPAERLDAICTAFLGRGNWPHKLPPNGLAKLVFMGSVENRPTVEFTPYPR